MTKELEASEIIKRNNFLEKENKELREKYIAYKEELETLRMLYNASSHKLSKLEKAIEICKEKNISLKCVKLNDNVFDYNADIKEIFMYLDDKLLTEEEFNLLKEVFESENK